MLYENGKRYAYQDDLDKLNGNANTSFADNPNNHLETGIYFARPNPDGKKYGFPSTNWASFLVFRIGDKVLQIKGDDDGQIFTRSCSINPHDLNVFKFNRIANDADLQVLQDQIDQLKKQIEAK